MIGRYIKPTAMEAELMRRYEAISSRLGQVQGQDELSSQLSQEIDCAVCFLPARIMDCIQCSNRNLRHTICKDCLNESVEVQARSQSGFSKNGREIICPLCIGGLHSHFDDQTLARWCSPLVFSKYIQVRDEAVERGERSRHEAQLVRQQNEHQSEILRLKVEFQQDARKKREAEIQRYRHHITNNILNILCPSCNLGILDFEGCFSVHHHTEFRDVNQETRTVGCLNFFCGWCHQVFKGSAECHGHVLVCPRSRRPGSYHGTMVECYAIRATDRRAEIDRYLAANNVIGDLRRELLENMKGELRDVGIHF